MNDSEKLETLKAAVMAFLNEKEAIAMLYSQEAQEVFKQMPHVALALGKLAQPLKELMTTIQNIN